MECPRCHNRDVNQFYEVNGIVYCRKCIQFNRVNVLEHRNTYKGSYLNSDVSYHLSFELSSRQAAISHGLVESFKNGRNAYVWAVCGSGKTEIVFEVMHYALMHGYRVCFCVPRKELVKELYERINESFEHITIGVLYGGVCKNSDAQFIVCTMHQLYRFENDCGFDLMVADEIDAFPFYRNEVLNEMFDRCCIGSFVKMSATIDEEDIIDGDLFVLNRRYHNHDLPLPHKIICPTTIQKYMLLGLIKRSERYIVYVPTVNDVDIMVDFLTKYHIRCLGVSSKGKDNDVAIMSLKANDISVLVSTTLLERGITIENVQVIVMYGNHSVYDWRTLIQIAGRVGRKPNYPDGYVYILTPVQTKDMRKCVRMIKKLNRMSV